MARGIQQPSVLGHHAYNRPAPVIGGSAQALSGFKNLVKNPDALAELALQHPSSPDKLLSPQDSSEEKNAHPHTLDTIPGGAKALNQAKKITRAEAEKSAQDMMSSFYGNMFKSMFSEIAGEDDSHSYGMAKEIFVEQLAQSLGKKHSPIHEKLINTMMRNQSSETPESLPSSNVGTSDEVDLPQEQENIPVAQQIVDNQSANPTLNTAAAPWPIIAPPKEYWGAYAPKIREAVHVYA